MGTTLMVVVGLLTAVEFLYIIYSADQHWFHACLGYKMWLDVIFGLGTTIYFALTGTISGIAIAAFSGAIFSLSLYTAAKLFGYKRYEKQEDGTREWVYTAPVWTFKSIIESTMNGIKSMIPKVKNTFNEISTNLKAA